MPVTTRAPAIVAFLRDIALAATCAVALLAALPGKAADAFTSDYLALADAAIADGMYSSAEENLVKSLAANHAKSNSPEYRRALSLLCQVLAGLRLNYVDEVSCKVLVPVDNDMYLLAEEPYSTGETAGGSDGIEVAESVPHNIDLVGVEDNILHSICDDTCFCA